jgi:hypothetical protein
MKSYLLKIFIDELNLKQTYFWFQHKIHTHAFQTKKRITKTNIEKKNQVLCSYKKNSKVFKLHHNCFE